MIERSYHPAKADIQHLMQVILGTLIVMPLMRFLYRFRVERAAGWDRSRPCVLAANHRSFLDPPAVAAWTRRPISFFARASLWKVPGIRQFLDLLGGIPIDRKAPALAQMKLTVDWLKAGRRILIFPEGTRTKTGRVGRLRSGPALFARRARVPLVPIYLHRTETGWPRGWLFLSPHGKVRVRVGSPVPVPPQLRGKEADEWQTRYIQRWMERQERELQGRPPR